MNELKRSSKTVLRRREIRVKLINDLVEPINMLDLGKHILGPLFSIQSQFIIKCLESKKRKLDVIIIIARSKRMERDGSVEKNLLSLKLQSL